MLTNEILAFIGFWFFFFFIRNTLQIQLVGVERNYKELEFLSEENILCLFLNLKFLRIFKGRTSK